MRQIRFDIANLPGSITWNYFNHDFKAYFLKEIVYKVQSILKAIPQDWTEILMRDSITRDDTTLVPKFKINFEISTKTFITLSLINNF